MVSDFPNIPTNRIRFRLQLNYQAFRLAHSIWREIQCFFSVYISEYFDVENEIFDVEVGLMLISAVSCSMRRDLNREQGYFWGNCSHLRTEWISWISSGNWHVRAWSCPDKKIFTHFQRGIPEAGSLFLLLNKCWHFYGRSEHTRSILKTPYCKHVKNRAEVLKRKISVGSFQPE